MDSIGKRLRLRREAIGLAQAEVARRAGMDNTTLNKIETGRTTSPRLSTITTLDRVLSEAEQQAPWTREPVSEIPMGRRIVPAEHGEVGPPRDQEPMEELPVTAQTLWALFHLLPTEQKHAVLQDMKSRVAVALQEEVVPSTPKE